MRLRVCVIAVTSLLFSGVTLARAIEQPLVDAYVKMLLETIETNGASSSRVEVLQSIWTNGSKDDTLSELESVKHGVQATPFEPTMDEIGLKESFEVSLLQLKMGEIMLTEFDGSFDELVREEDPYDVYPYVMQYVALLSPSALGNQIIDSYYVQFSDPHCTNVPINFIQLCCTYLVSGEESAQRIRSLAREHGQSDLFIELLCFALEGDYVIRKKIEPDVAGYYEECILNTFDISVINAIISNSGPYRNALINIKKNQLRDITKSIELAECMDSRGDMHSFAKAK